RQGHRGAAAGEAPHPEGHPRAVTVDHRDRLRRDPQLVRADLGERGLDALSDGGDARVHDDVTGGIDLDPGVLPGAEPRFLHQAANTDADEAPRAARSCLLGAGRVVVDGLERRIERGAVVTAVVDRTLVERRAAYVVRHLRWRDEVAPAQLQRVRVQPRGRDVDQSLAYEGGLV